MRLPIAPPLRALPGVLVLVVVGAGVGAPSAQGQDTPATLRVELGTGATRTLGDPVATADATLLFRVTPRLFLGGAGTAFLGRQALPGPVPGTDLELSTGYGGVVLHAALLERPGRALWLRMTGGAGNAKLDLARGGTRIAADNFAVLIPELGAEATVSGPLRVAVSLGYRAAFAVEDLPGVTTSDLRGPIARLSLVGHRF